MARTPTCGYYLERDISAILSAPLRKTQVVAWNTLRAGNWSQVAQDAYNAWPGMPWVNSNSNLVGRALCELALNAVSQLVPLPVKLPFTLG